MLDIVLESEFVVVFETKKLDSYTQIVGVTRSWHVGYAYQVRDPVSGRIEFLQQYKKATYREYDTQVWLSHTHPLTEPCCLYANAQIVVILFIVIRTSGTTLRCAVDYFSLLHVSLTVL